MTNTYTTLLTYGSLAMRVGAMAALAKRAAAQGNKQESARHWKAYYDAEKEKERCLRALLRELGLRTATGRSRSST
jgi:hypothetical protein